MLILITGRCDLLFFSFCLFFSCCFQQSRQIHVRPQSNTCSSALKPPDSCHNEPGSDCGKNMYGWRFSKMRERERRGSLLISLNTQPAMLHLFTCHLFFHPPPTPPSPSPQTQSKPQKFNNELPSCAKTWDGEKSEQLGTLSFFCASPAVGILSAQSSHRHLNLPQLHPIPAVALFKSLPPPSPPHF